MLCHADGTPLPQIPLVIASDARPLRAGGPVNGAHRLRHTSSSHFTMRGGPARAIQEVAGHQDLLTTQRYLHLTPGAVTRAIRLLEQAPPTAETSRNAGDGREATR